MESNIQILNFPEKVGEIAARAVEQVISGEISPVTLAANIAKLEKIIAAVKDNSLYSNAVLNSLERRGEGGAITVGDIKIEKIEAGVKYDYSSCGDSQMLDLQERMEVLKSDIKRRETFLKGLAGKTIIVDEDTGIVLEIFPPSRSSKTTYKATEIKSKNR